MSELYAWCLRAAGWHVETAATGEQGLAAAPALLPSVIVMDVRLPGIGGLEVTRRLKASTPTAHVPIVAISGADLVCAQALAKEAGCDAFVTKPCAPEQLRALLDALVAGAGRSSS